MAQVSDLIQLAEECQNALSKINAQGGHLDENVDACNQQSGHGHTPQAVNRKGGWRPRTGPASLVSSQYTLGVKTKLRLLTRTSTPAQLEKLRGDRSSICSEEEENSDFTEWDVFEKIRVTLNSADSAQLSPARVRDMLLKCVAVVRSLVPVDAPPSSQVAVSTFASSQLTRLRPPADEQNIAGSVGSISNNSNDNSDKSNNNNNNINVDTNGTSSVRSSSNSNSNDKNGAAIEISSIHSASNAHSSLNNVTPRSAMATSRLAITPSTTSFRLDEAWNPTNDTTPAPDLPVISKPSNVKVAREPTRSLVSPRARTIRQPKPSSVQSTDTPDNKHTRLRTSTPKTATITTDKKKNNNSNNIISTPSGMYSGVSTDSASMTLGNKSENGYNAGHKIVQKLKRDDIKDRLGDCSNGYDSVQNLNGRDVVASLSMEESPFAQGVQLAFDAAAAESVTAAAEEDVNETLKHRKPPEQQQQREEEHQQQQQQQQLYISATPEMRKAKRQQFKINSVAQVKQQRYQSPLSRAKEEPVQKSQRKRACAKEPAQQQQILPNNPRNIIRHDKKEPNTTLEPNKKHQSGGINGYNVVSSDRNGSIGLNNLNRAEAAKVTTDAPICAPKLFKRGLVPNDEAVDQSCVGNTVQLGFNVVDAASLGITQRESRRLTLEEIVAAKSALCNSSPLYDNNNPAICEDQSGNNNNDDGHSNGTSNNAKDNNNNNETSDAKSSLDDINDNINDNNNNGNDNLQDGNDDDSIDIGFTSDTRNGEKYIEKLGDDKDNKEHGDDKNSNDHGDDKNNSELRDDTNDLNNSNGSMNEEDDEALPAPPTRPHLQIQTSSMNISSFSDDGFLNYNPNPSPNPSLNVGSTTSGPVSPTSFFGLQSDTALDDCEAENVASTGAQKTSNPKSSVAVASDPNSVQWIFEEAIKAEEEQRAAAKEAQAVADAEAKAHALEEAKAKQEANAKAEEFEMAVSEAQLIAGLDEVEASMKAETARKSGLKFLEDRGEEEEEQQQQQQQQQHQQGSNDDDGEEERRQQGYDEQQQQQQGDAAVAVVVEEDEEEQQQQQQVKIPAAHQLNLKAALAEERARRHKHNNDDKVLLSRYGCSSSAKSTNVTNTDDADERAKLCLKTALRVERERRKAVLVPPTMNALTKHASQPVSLAMQGNSNYNNNNKSTTCKLGRMLSHGIRLAISEAGYLTTRSRLVSDDFTYTASHTPSIEFGSAGQRHVQFNILDHCPTVFRALCKEHGVVPSALLRSISEHPLVNGSSGGGKSGATFFRTFDERFVLKEVKRQEKDLMLRMLPEYLAHTRRYPFTLLPQMFGLFTLDLPAGVVNANNGHQNITVIIMRNILFTGHKMRVIEVQPDDDDDDDDGDDGVRNEGNDDKETRSNGLISNDDATSAAVVLHEIYDLKGSVINRFTDQRAERLSHTGEPFTEERARGKTRRPSTSRSRMARTSSTTRKSVRRTRSLDWDDPSSSHVAVSKNSRNGVVSNVARTGTVCLDTNSIEAPSMVPNSAARTSMGSNSPANTSVVPNGAVSMGMAPNSGLSTELSGSASCVVPVSPRLPPPPPVQSFSNINAADTVDTDTHTVADATGSIAGATGSIDASANATVGIAATSPNVATDASAATIADIASSTTAAVIEGHESMSEDTHAMQTPQRQRQRQRTGISASTDGEQLQTPLRSQRRPVLSRRNSAPSVLKDLNLRCKFKLGKLRRHALMSQLDSDTEFLERYNIMDYSLLLGVCSAQSVNTQTGFGHAASAQFSACSYDGSVGVGSGGTTGKHRSRMGNWENTETSSENVLAGSGNALSESENVPGTVSSLIFDEEPTDEVARPESTTSSSTASSKSSKLKQRSWNRAVDSSASSPTSSFSLARVNVEQRVKVGQNVPSYRSRAGSMPDLDPTFWQEAAHEYNVNDNNSFVGPETPFSVSHTPPSSEMHAVLQRAADERQQTMALLPSGTRVGVEFCGSGQGKRSRASSTMARSHYTVYAWRVETILDGGESMDVESGSGGSSDGGGGGGSNDEMSVQSHRMRVQQHNENDNDDDINSSDFGYSDEAGKEEQEQQQQVQQVRADDVAVGGSEIGNDMQEKQNRFSAAWDISSAEDDHTTYDSSSPVFLPDTPGISRKKIHHNQNRRNKNKKSSWVIYRRYKDFMKLCSGLENELRSAHSSAQLPVLPPRKRLWFMDPNFVKQRAEALNTWLCSILYLVDHQGGDSPSLRDFLTVKADRSPNGWKVADHHSGGSNGLTSSSSTESRNNTDWSSTTSSVAVQSTKSKSSAWSLMWGAQSTPLPASSSMSIGGVPPMAPSGGSTRSVGGPATRCHHASSKSGRNGSIGMPPPVPHTSRIQRTSSLDFHTGTQGCDDWSSQDVNKDDDKLALLQDAKVWDELGGKSHSWIQARRVQQGNSNRVKQPVFLFLGLVDVLQTYTLTKRLESKYKGWTANANGISAVDPAAYRLRFVQYLDQYVFK